MRIILFSLVAVIFSACVSNKKTTLLQRKDLHAKNLTTDSVFRTYDVRVDNYLVQPNDILSVRFESITPVQFDFLANQENVSGNLNLQGGSALVLGEMVNEKGEIPFPVLGRVKVAGLTVFQIQDKLQEEANKFLESPVVKVTLLNFRVTLLGEVAREGTVQLINNQVSLLEVIGLAGGLGEFADRSNIKLIRNRNGQSEVVYLNLLDENFINSPYYYAYQNDVLVVPPLRQKPFRKYSGQNISLLVSTLSLLLLTINLTK